MGHGKPFREAKELPVDFCWNDRFTVGRNGDGSGLVLYCYSAKKISLSKLELKEVSVIEFFLGAKIGIPN